MGSIPPKGWVVNCLHDAGAVRDGRTAAPADVGFEVGVPSVR